MESKTELIFLLFLFLVVLEKTSVIKIGEIIFFFEYTVSNQAKTLIQSRIDSALYYVLT